MTFSPQLNNLYCLKYFQFDEHLEYCEQCSEMAKSLYKFYSNLSNITKKFGSETVNRATNGQKSLISKLLY